LPDRSLACLIGCLGQNPSLTIDVSHPGAKLSPTLYGIFFEEINHAGDGGLYTELIRNRTFKELTAWAPTSHGPSHRIQPAF